MNDIDPASANAEPEDVEPEVLEVEWDLEQVEVLFGDLERGAEILHVQVRTASESGPPKDQATSLGESLALLRQGEARAIQIRYAFEQQHWCDTLMVGNDKVRIIRTREPQRPNGG